MAVKTALSVISAIAFASMVSMPLSAMTYYVDSVTGRDGNAGTSQAAPWNSINKVNSVSLHPGDQVLFKRGSIFRTQLNVNASGMSGSPIVYGAYGVGSDPTITGTAHGVYGSGKSWVVVSGMHIIGTSDTAVDVTNGSSHWKFQDMNFTNTAGGIFIWFSNQIDIEHCHVNGGTAEGFWMWKGDSLQVHNSTVSGVTGFYTDDMQLTNVTNAVITNNSFSLDNNTSSKGNLIAEGGSMFVSNNLFIGGNFGNGIAQGNTTIQNNHYVNNRNAKYNWSSGIMVDPSGVNVNATNVVIKNNLIQNPGKGIFVWGTGVRDHFTVTGNVIENPSMEPTLFMSHLTNSVVSNNTIWYSNSGKPEPSSPLSGTIGPIY
jgi:polysaccharidase protein